MGSICSGFMFRTRPNGTLGGFYGSSDVTIPIDLGTGTRRMARVRQTLYALAGGHARSAFAGSRKRPKIVPAQEWSLLPVASAAIYFAKSPLR